MLTLLVELVQVLDAPLVGAGTDYIKCFDLIPEATSMALLDLHGMDEGVLRAFRGMYGQLKRMFKIKGCLGAWWAATNGVLQGCLSVIVINAPMTTWKHTIDDVQKPVTVHTRELPPAPQAEELPSSNAACSPAPVRNSGGSWTWRGNSRRTQTMGGALHPCLHAHRLPTGKAHAMGKSVGPPRTARDAHPGQC